MTFVEGEKDGVGGVAGLYGVISVTVSPDGKYVYSASVTDGAVAAFGRNATTGELTFVEDEKDGTGGVDGFDRAASIALSPDGKHLYVAAKNDDALAVFSQNAMVGNLTFIEMVEDGEGVTDSTAPHRSMSAQTATMSMLQATKITLSQCSSGTGRQATSPSLKPRRTASEASKD